MLTVEAIPGNRTRTVSWEDPVAAARLAREISGLEQLQAIMRGNAPPPPVAVLLGVELEDATEGRAVFALEPAEYHYNPMGSVHGGVIATLLDFAMASAVNSTLPAGTSFTTLDFTVQIVRALTIDSGRVHCEGQVLHAGGRVATAEGRLIDESGRLYAHATTTCLISRPPREERAA
jgi:uncharacterized protein (TIGR00369 family)